MTFATVTVDVEVDLSEFDDEDIREEAQSRGFLEGDPEGDILEMFYAFKLGKTEHAMELAKKIAMDHTGKIL